MTFIEILKKQWYVFVVILAIIIILLNLSSIFSLFAGESFSTLRLYELNGSYNPRGFISLSRMKISKNFRSWH